MMHLDERTIDILLQNPALLDDGARNSAELHLLMCDGCRAIADSLSVFYAGLEKARVVPFAPTAHQDAVIRTLTGIAAVVRLTPYAPRPTVFPRHIREGISVLAAKGSPEKQMTRFETVATLASSAQGLLARVVQDTELKKFKVYLLADDPSQREAVLLSIPRLSLNLLLDEKGQREFTLPPDFPPEEWPRLEAIARLPIAYDVVTTAALQKSGKCTQTLEGLGGSYPVSFTYGHEELTLDAGDPATNPPGTALIFFSASGPPTMLELERGKGRVALPLLPPAFTLRLYA
jgi:hypothetical protein